MTVQLLVALWGISCAWSFLFGAASMRKHLTGRWLS
jgi:hypothetical protein